MKIFAKTVSLLLSFILVLHASIIGSWEVDQIKTKQENSKVDDKVLGVTMAIFSYIDIYANHVIICKKADFLGNWKEGKNGYVIESDRGKRLLTLLENNTIKFEVSTVDGLKIPIFYRRVVTKNRVKLDQSMTKMRLNHIYRSQMIDGSYRFLMLEEQSQKLYIAQSGKVDNITKDQIVSAHIDGRGSVFGNSFGVDIRNSKIYTNITNKEVEVISRFKVKFQGVLYGLLSDY